MRIKPLVLKDGRQAVFDKSDDTLDQDNFSYRVIESTESVLVPSGQDMVGVKYILVEGTVEVDGQLILDEFSNPVDFPEDNFSFRRIESSQFVVIPTGQQMLLVDAGNMEIEGQLRVDGQLIFDEIKDTEFTPQPPSVEPDNFSYQTVASGVTIEIPSNQQMLVDGYFDVEGMVEIDGELSVIVDEIDDCLPPYWILPSQNFVVPARKQLAIVGMFQLDGSLQIDGNFSLGA